jgi:hypothetical protein
MAESRDLNLDGPWPSNDLTPADVRALASAFGLALTGDDLAEVTHRLNAMRDALAPLAALPLEPVEPVPPSPEPLA